MSFASNGVRPRASALLFLGTLASLTACLPKSTGRSGSAVQSSQDAPISSDNLTTFLGGPQISLVDASTLAPSSGLTLKTFNVSDLATTLTVGNATSNPMLPQSQWGIWWMDGNPLPDKNVTMANVKFTTDSQGLLVGTFSVYDAGNFAFDGNDNGTKLFQGCLAFNLSYEIHFDQAIQNATIYPVVHLNLPLGNAITVRIPPSIAHFTMTYRADGLWQRDSFFFGSRVNQYKFTRVINGDGTPNHDTSPALSAVTFSDSPTQDLRDPYARYQAYMTNTAQLTQLQVVTHGP